ncbi:MAG: acyl-CoA dehydrogenase family protein [Actinomycetota bacterium]
MAAWPFSSEHDELRATVRAFVAKELAPNAATWEAEEGFPREIFSKAGKLGLFGMKYPADVGGSGPDYLADAVVTEELTGCASGGTAASLGAHKDLACLYIYRFGNPGQHQRWLGPMLRGESIGALAVTEPDTGSDVAAIRTTAHPEQDEWVIDGSKTFITNGAWADVVVVAAKTDADAGHAGITLFVVETTTPGFQADRMHMMGWRPSQTGQLYFSGLRVPDAARLGEVGSGFYAIMQNFAWERLVMALAQAEGARRTLELSIDYAKERQAFGRSVASFQIWRHRFADMMTRIAAAQALTYRALIKFQSGEDATREAAMAKLLTSELFVETADMCMQVHGGAGYTAGAAAERIYRDARLGPIGGGTSEIMKEIVSKISGL